MAKSTKKKDQTYLYFLYGGVMRHSILRVGCFTGSADDYFEQYKKTYGNNVQARYVEAENDEKDCAKFIEQNKKVIDDELGSPFFASTCTDMVKSLKQFTGAKQAKTWNTFTKEDKEEKKEDKPKKGKKKEEDEGDDEGDDEKEEEEKPKKGKKKEEKKEETKKGKKKEAEKDEEEEEEEDEEADEDEKPKKGKKKDEESKKGKKK